MNIDSEIHMSDVIEIVHNVDRIPLTHSGVKQMWIIACKIHYDPGIHQLFPVGVEFDIEDKERSGRPKVYEDAESEALLVRDLCQT